MSVGRSVCGDETKDRLSFAKVAEGTHGSLVGARPTVLVGVTDKSLDADEWDDVSAPGDAMGNVWRYQRAVGNKEEEKPMMSSYQVRYVVPQQRLSTGHDNGMDTQIFRFVEKRIEFVCR